MRILLLEDNPTTRPMAALALGEVAKVTTAETGEEAVGLFNVAKTAGEPYDLLVFDVATPRKTGITALEEIRAQGDTVPAVFWTALSRHEQVEGATIGEHAERLGAIFLEKPSPVEELFALLRGEARG